MKRYCAYVAYDGTRYYGFQRQVDQFKTVQGELDAALETLGWRTTSVGHKSPVIGAGRTDSGVHATGQVIAFELDWQHSLEDLSNAINANLPNDILVYRLRETDESFHPRFDARWRSYRYVILNREEPNPHWRQRCWHLIKRLDVAAMNAACGALIGSHDFATFGQPPQGNNTVREVKVAKCEWHAPFVTFDVVANAFLQRMVRSLVGSLRYVGDGRWSVDEFAAALAARDRSRSAPVAPPQGLCLVGVDYERGGPSGSVMEFFV